MVKSKRKSLRRKSLRRKSLRRKSLKRKSLRRKSKCHMSNKSKYLKRPGPPYPAQDCKNRIRLGNDHLYYKSKPDKNGIYKWVKEN